MPLVKKTRAPGMALFVVALVTALLAGLGADRALKGESRRMMTPALIVGGIVALLGVTGVFGHIAEALAAAKVAAAGAGQSAIVWGAASSGVALAVVAAALAYGRTTLTPRLQALVLILAVGTDLWLNARPFWNYVSPYTRDEVIDRIAATPRPFRVLNAVYPGSSLMVFDVSAVLGYHGNELRYYDELLDRNNDFKNLGFLPLWDLLAVRYVIVAPGQADSLPGFRRVLDTVPIFDGARVNVFERTTAARYARVVPAAIKVDSVAIVPTLLHPRMDYSRLVLFTPDQPVSPEPLKQMELPPPSPSQASVTAWQPGRMSVALDPPPPHASYLLVAENWYPDWHATVDGRATQVLRGDHSLMTVALPPGAKAVELTFRSELYERGKTITIASLALLLIAVLAGAVSRRARHG